MDRIYQLIEFIRGSVLALAATALVATGIGVSWTAETRELLRQHNLFCEGCVEVSVEGMSEKSLRDAEDDAKRKAIEKACGLFVNYERINNEENVTTLDTDGAAFRNKQEDRSGLSMTGDAQFVSISYLERKKLENEMFYVSVKAVVRVKK